ncbi:MAG: GNAT family N-acetyltransferase [Mobilitalea sp.]
MIEKEVLIRSMQYDDIEKILPVLKEAYMIGREEQYRTYFNSCFEQNQSKDRVTFIAFMDNEVVGYVNIIFKSNYVYFVEKNIPEINDLYVVPARRKNGVGKMLLDECERSAAGEYQYIGLGVGLYKDYGSAQRLYTNNGYRLDGNGLIYNNIPAIAGNQVYVDDDLLLYLYKELR